MSEGHRRTNVRLGEKKYRTTDLRVIEKSGLFSLKNKVCDKEGLCAELWQF